MVRRSTWWSTAIATAVGAAVGTAGWFIGMGKHFSQSHPGWALFWITIAITIVAQIVTRSTVEEEIRYRNYRAAQSSHPSQTPGH
ncbi:MAG TPA: hypothetical protein VL967_04015 [Terracidiphilus sp.]|nr:hypothetical protein [Terracidiphilus sp.]